MIRWKILLSLITLLSLSTSANQTLPAGRGGTTAEVLPRSSTENCFYIMPLFGAMRTNNALSYEEKRTEFLNMKQQLGEDNLYHRLGFSFIYPPSIDGYIREACELAQEYQVHLGLIFALQSHTRNTLRRVADDDLRLYQWRLDGKDWKGAFTSSGSLEVPEDQRDYKIPTPSRYALALRDYNARDALDWARAVKRLMADYPGVITCINGPIEEELAIGGHKNNSKLADYSPFAITEFRDWLRHTGLYDATTGPFGDEGANALLVGTLKQINGILRSQFYDDPSPANSNGTGVSFNSFFGTHFSTWSLRYWDLERYPHPITNENFDCTPESGSTAQRSLILPSGSTPAFHPAVNSTGSSAAVTSPRPTPSSRVGIPTISVSYPTGSLKPISTRYVWIPAPRPQLISRLTGWPSAQIPSLKPYRVTFVSKTTRPSYSPIPQVNAAAIRSPRP